MDIIEKYKDNTLFYQFKRLSDYENINHLFTSRIGWNMDYVKDQLAWILNVPVDNIVRVKQVHGTNIKVIDSRTENLQELSQLEADGLLTNLADIVLTTYHADCVPIYFFDKIKGVVGLAHGGWKGTFENISGKMIDTIKSVYKSNVGDLHIVIGPSIGPCCYEVREDLFKLFSSRYKEYKDILIKNNGKIFLDLWKVNYLQLLDRGIPRENIAISKTCTSCNVDKLYSYRKEKGTTNRMIAAICLK